MTDGKVEETIELIKTVDDPDRLYLDLREYHDLINDIHMVGYHESNEIIANRELELFGVEVVVVSGIDERVVLDSSKFPKARDFKNGDAQPIRLS